MGPTTLVWETRLQLHISDDPEIIGVTTVGCDTQQAASQTACPIAANKVFASINGGDVGESMLYESMDRVVRVFGVREMYQLSWPINMMTSGNEAEVKSFLSVALGNCKDPRERGSIDAFSSNMRPV